MTHTDIIHLLRAHSESFFPKECPNCHRRYENVRDYILQTEKIGHAYALDAELGDWKPQEPLGALAFTNCTCGTTLALSTAGIPVEQVHEILDWVKAEQERRGLRAFEITDWLREEIRREVLAAPP